MLTRSPHPAGAIHLLIEGYFSLNHRRMPQMQDYLGQGWKEYAHSDSRYMTAEPFVVCMESVTAVSPARSSRPCPAGAAGQRVCV